jgi:hypothetical protein
MEVDQRVADYQGALMIQVLRQLEDGCGLVIDRSILDQLGLDAGASVEIELDPQGRGLLIRPAAGNDGEGNHAHEVAEISRRLIERHPSVFKRLAE